MYVSISQSLPCSVVLYPFVSFLNERDPCTLKTFYIQVKINNEESTTLDSSVFTSSFYPATRPPVSRSTDFSVVQ